MNTIETIKLDRVPKGKMPVLHASQYDNGRTHGIDLTNLGEEWKLDGTETLTINERKVDNNICSMDIENTFVGSSHIEFASFLQMCACAGSNFCELRISKGDVDLGTLNFILEVEPDPTADGIESESEIKNLKTQIEAITEEVIGDNYYTKTQTDDAIATAIEDKADSTYVDTELAKKADKTDTYTKMQVDNALNNKMNKANPTGSGSFSLNRKSGSTVGQYSHAEGYNCEASGQGSHAEGLSTKSTGYQASHAEGAATNASGTLSHAEGFGSTASGEASHAEGSSTIASGECSHAEGKNTEARGECQHVFGKYNIIDGNNEFIEIVGNGPVGIWNERSNARTLDWDGNETLAGDLTYNGNKSLTSEISRLDGKIDNLPAPMIFKGTLGIGGTIQTLPTASASNEGFTYKVITDGTYAGQTAKVGDVFTSNGSAWVYIPSGDEDNDTWRNIKVNGTEVLGNGISSGSVDFVGSENIDVEFDSDGNKIGIKTKNIYTQSEVDTLIANAVDSVLPTDSVSKSAIANFETDYAKPIEFKAYIEAVQASGTPTPSTPLPISGVSSVNVTRCGANLCNQAEIVSAYPSKYTIDADGSIKTVGNLSVADVLWTNKSKVSGVLNVIFVLKYQNTGSVGIRPKIIYTDGTNSVVYPTNTQDYSTKTLLTTAGKTVEKIVVDYGTNNPTNFFLDVTLDTGATTYEAYNGTDVIIALGDTYYGGYVTQDKLGHRQLVVTVVKENIDLSDKTPSTASGYDRYSIPLSNTTTAGDLSYDKKCSVLGSYSYSDSRTSEHYYMYSSSLIVFFTENTFRTGEFEVTYPLATPIVIDLPDGEPISAIAGVNNVFNDSGDTEVSFKCSVEDYVNAHSGGGGLRSLGNSNENLSKGGDDSEEEPKEDEKDPIEPISKK